MDSLNNYILEYTMELKKGHIQKAYKGIMVFMSELRAYLDSKHSDYSASALYFGYMDMTYFAFTPSDLKDKKLKIAVVYLHEENKFELWLAGANRQVQAEYVELFSHKNLGGYTLSEINPGVDSIIVSNIIENPNFDNQGEMRGIIETEILKFAKDMISMLK